MYNFFKNIFGFDDSYKNNRRDNFSRENHGNSSDEATEEDYSNIMDPPDTHHGYSVFTNPLEMHRYFEQQMDEMMRSFQDFFRPDSFHGIERFVTSAYPETESSNESLRDQFLKSGYEQLREKDVRKHEDTDLDGEFDLDTLDSIMKRYDSTQQPYQQHRKSQASYFRTSVTSRTIQNPDGTIETHHTMRDHKGNEENTVTKQIGDKKYSITTRRDKNGEEEKIENIVNMDEEEVASFLKKWKKRQQSIEEDPNKYFPYDNFFK